MYRTIPIFCALCIGVYAHAHAQVTRLVVGFQDGGTSSVIARALAESLQRDTGTTIIVESMPGAGGLVAAEHVHRKKPDGTTLFLMSSTSLMRVPHRLGLVPVAPVAEFDYVFVVGKAQRALSLSSYMKNAHDSHYASQGFGSFPQLIAEELARFAKITLIPVAFRGSGPAIISVLGYHVPATIVPMPDALPQLGGVRALAIFGSERSAFLPDVPTALESGYDVSARGWIGVFGPPGMPDKIVSEMENDITRALEGIPVATWRLGFERFRGDTQVLRASYGSEYERWIRVLRRIESK